MWISRWLVCIMRFSNFRASSNKEATGRPPFQVLYNVAREIDAGGTRILDQPTISSVQSRTRVQLLTSQVGRIFYEVKQIGDSNYPLNQNKDHVIPRKERLLFEQSVIGRPSAYFKKPSRISHCLRDPFVSSDPIIADDVIVLEGQAPFFLDLSIKNLATSHIHWETVEVRESHWKVNLPNYIFSSIGPHLVSIEGIRDASSCKQAALDPLKSSIWVDVAESAAIVPYERREHFCVGDVAQFQMEGSPPWTVGFVCHLLYILPTNWRPQLPHQQEISRTSCKTVASGPHATAPRKYLHCLHLAPAQAVQDYCGKYRVPSAFFAICSGRPWP